eukprot:4624627-Amphidinium_carterae.2
MAARVDPDVQAHNGLLYAHVASKDTGALRASFLELRNMSVEPNVQTYNTLIRGLVQQDRAQAERRKSRPAFKEACVPGFSECQVATTLCLQATVFRYVRAVHPCSSGGCFMQSPVCDALRPQDIDVAESYFQELVEVRSLEFAETATEEFYDNIAVSSLPCGTLNTSLGNSREADIVEWKDTF